MVLRTLETLGVVSSGLDATLTGSREVGTMPPYRVSHTPEKFLEAAVLSSSEKP